MPQLPFWSCALFTGPVQVGRGGVFMITYDRSDPLTLATPFHWPGSGLPMRGGGPTRDGGYSLTGGEVVSV